MRRKNEGRRRPYCNVGIARKVGSVTVPGADLHSYVSTATGLRALLAKTDEPLCSAHGHRD